MLGINHRDSILSNETRSLTKMEDLHCKAQLVAGEHVANVPSTITHANTRDCLHCPSTCSLEPARCNGHRHHEYLNHCSMQRNFFTILGPNWALYGLKLDNRAYQKNLSEFIYSLGYKSCLAKQDLCYKICTRNWITEESSHTTLTCLSMWMS